MKPIALQEPQTTDVGLYFDYPIFASRGRITNAHPLGDFSNPRMSTNGETYSSYNSLRAFLLTCEGLLERDIIPACDSDWGGKAFLISKDSSLQYPLSDHTSRSEIQLHLDRGCWYSLWESLVKGTYRIFFGDCATSHDDISFLQWVIYPLELDFERGQATTIEDAVSIYKLIDIASLNCPTLQTFGLWPSRQTLPLYIAHKYDTILSEIDCPSPVKYGTYNYGFLDFATNDLNERVRAVSNTQFVGWTLQGNTPYNIPYRHNALLWDLISNMLGMMQYQAFSFSWIPQYNIRKTIYRKYYEIYYDDDWILTADLIDPQYIDTDSQTLTQTEVQEFTDSRMLLQRGRDAMPAHLGLIWNLNIPHDYALTSSEIAALGDDGARVITTHDLDAIIETEETDEQYCTFGVGASYETVTVSAENPMNVPAFPDNLMKDYVGQVDVNAGFVFHDGIYEYDNEGVPQRSAEGDSWGAIHKTANFQGGAQQGWNNALKQMETDSITMSPLQSVTAPRIIEPDSDKLEEAGNDALDELYLIYSTESPTYIVNPEDDPEYQKYMPCAFLLIDAAGNDSRIGIYPDSQGQVWTGRGAGPYIDMSEYDDWGFDGKPNFSEELSTDNSDVLGSVGWKFATFNVTS